MSIRPLWFSLSFLGAFLLGALAPSAQTLVEELPPEFEEPIENWVSETEVQTSPYHRKRFTDDYAEKIQSGQILAVASEIISQFGTSHWGENAFKHEKIMHHLSAFLDAMRTALNAPGIEGPLETKFEQNTFLAVFNQQQFGLNSLQMEILTDASGNEVTGYFKGTPNQLMLYEWAQGDEKIRLLLASSQVRQWRLLENALTNLVTEQVALISKANIQVLKNAVVRWENFLEKGYSQMPWESLVNGWLVEPPGFPEPGPPGHQWIILHPTLGLEFSVNKLDETRVKEAMHVEVLGHIWYRGRQLEDYWGASATVSLREDLDPGLGVMIHIKRFWNIGIAWHDSDDDPYLLFSVDLFRFAKQNAPKYVEKYKSIRTQLGLE